MLHPIPDSTERTRLLEVVEMQRVLIGALCHLAERSTVDRSWLETIWPAIPVDWIRRFWTNDKGSRAKWILLIAAATPMDKREILGLVAEQLRFDELYKTPPTVRLTQHNWGQPVFAAVNNLLKSFYAPLFYKHEGFQNSTGKAFHKEHFISGFSPRVRICPYTDFPMQDTKLDHFLPKDQFPMLSCHPDNLIPCSSDANSGSHKGTKIPLDPHRHDQAGNWFHPRLRSAVDTFRLEFPASTAPQPVVSFVAISAQDQTRLNNMVQMFGLSDLWGSYLDDEVQSVANDVNGWLQYDGQEPSQANVKKYVLRRAHQEKNRIGRDGLATVKSFYYEHIASTPVLLDQIIRVCSHGA